MENWKDIKNYEGLYQVSDLGRIKRLESVIKSSERNGGKRICREKILKQNLKRNGYLTVDLCKNGVVKTISVHRIVALNFIPNENTLKTEIDHINCIKTDNRVKNLEWVSPRENKDREKENHLYNNPNKKQVRCKQLNKIFESSYEAGMYINNIYFHNSKQIKVMANKIRQCCNKKQKIAYGFTWEYVEGSTTIS